jgi:hypothetical protein
MSNWIPADQVTKGRIHAIRKENERLIQMLREYGALRDHMFGNGWMVLYTERGAIDIPPNKFAACVKPFDECDCRECAKSE